MEERNNHTEEELNTQDNTNTEAQQETNQQEETNELEEELEEELNAEDTPDSAVTKLEKQLAEAKDKYLRLYSEYENFRRRTSKERLELIKTANEDLMTTLLPVLDDFERAFKTDEQNETSNEGYQLIYNKLYKNLESKGLSLMEVEKGSEFNPEFHEAITQMPAPEEDLKGKVIDIIEKGYYLGEKVIRFAKVVIGS